MPIQQSTRGSNMDYRGRDNPDEVDGSAVSKAKEVMRAEDKFDRQAEKERVRQRKLEEKRKRKEAEQRRRKVSPRRERERGGLN